MYLGKHKFVPPKREAYIEDEGDAFQVLLFEDGRQCGACYLPDEGDGSSFEFATQVCNDWMSFNDKSPAARNIGRQR